MIYDWNRVGVDDLIRYTFCHDFSKTFEGIVLSREYLQNSSQGRGFYLKVRHSDDGQIYEIKTSLVNLLNINFEPDDSWQEIKVGDFITCVNMAATISISGLIVDLIENSKNCKIRCVIHTSQGMKTLNCSYFSIDKLIKS